MKAKKQNRTIYIFSISLFLLLCSFFTPLSPTAYASADAERNATEECAQIGDPTPLGTQRRAACKKGFIAGYDGGKTKAEACAGLTASPRNNCYDGFDEGVEAKKKAPHNDGVEGAAAKKSKAASCNQYNNAANKRTCQRAYDAHIKVMAQTAGRKAGLAGNPSPCNNLGFGGSGAAAACKSAYQKGKNEAGKSGRAKCGDIQTYFDFSKICEGTTSEAGGNQSPIVAIGLAVVGWISALVALAVVGGIVYGGFLYLTARDNTGQTQKGIVVITNSVVALVAWMFAYALINFIVPGGLFNG